MGMNLMQGTTSVFSYKGSVDFLEDLDLDTLRTGEVFFSKDDQSCYVFDGSNFIELQDSSDSPEPDNHQSIKITHCPNCGARIDFSASLHRGLYHCDYCDSFINLYDEGN